ncbi:MAG: hypothetical protein KBS94_05440 [Prevotella sp.]|nr:hypothetical protein [Candidatus Equicola faecalis]
MKKLLFFLLLASFALTSCDTDNKDDPKVSDKEIHEILVEGFDQTLIPEYEVMSDEILTPEQMADFLFNIDETNIDEINDEEIHYREKVAEKRRKFLEGCERDKIYLDQDNPDSAFTLIFHKETFYYKTINQFGDPITLSAFLAYGEYWRPFKYIPLDQDHIFFVCPYTHTKEDECATESDGGKEFTTMVHDNLFIMPDGQGFGADKNHDQTYLNHNLHARQYYDALVAGEAIYRSKGGKFEDDYTLHVLGASQGAGDAIALHKYLDTNTYTLDLSLYYLNPLLKMAANAICDRYHVPRGTRYVQIPFRDRFKFERSFVCCGPYCPEATMLKYLEWGRSSYPCVIPLVIKSMRACYPDFAKKYPETMFFSEKWNAHKDWFDELYLHKVYNSADLNRVILRELGETKVNFISLRELLSDEMNDPNSQIFKDLMACLREQDLTSGWYPTTNMWVCYSKNDEVVPYVNSEKLFELGTVTQKFDLKLTHVACCAIYMAAEW